MGKHAKLKEKQKWSDEKLHLENARKLRGIYFIDLEDKEFKETIKNARKKLETLVAPAMPCKIMKKNCGGGGSHKVKTKFACILGSCKCVTACSAGEKASTIVGTLMGTETCQRRGQALLGSRYWMKTTG